MMNHIFLKYSDIYSNIYDIINLEIEEDDDDMKCYNKPKTLTRKIVLSKDDIED